MNEYHESPDALRTRSNQTIARLLDRLVLGRIYSLRELATLVNRLPDRPHHLGQDATDQWRNLRLALQNYNVRATEKRYPHRIVAHAFEGEGKGNATHYIARSTEYLRLKAAETPPSGLVTHRRTA